MTFWLRRRRVRYAYLAAGLAVLTTAATTAALPASASTDSAPSPLSAAPLGLNTAPWDYIYAADASAGGGVDVIQPLLQAAGIGMLRYGGGSYADYYDWQTNTNIQNCLPMTPRRRSPPVARRRTPSTSASSPSRHGRSARRAS